MTEKDSISRLDVLEEKINRSVSLAEIRNLINRYLIYLENGDVKGIASCFAMEDPEVSLELGRGKYQGKKEIMDFYGQRVEIGRMGGVIVEHGAAAPSVEIAGDGKTARVSLLSPGFKCLARAESEAWDMGRYYIELTATKEGWKFWHLQWIVVVEGDTCYGWLTQNRSYLKECEYPLLDEACKAEELVRPSDCFVDYYKPDEINQFLPEPPAPYETWDGYGVRRDTRGY